MIAEKQLISMQKQRQATASIESVAGLFRSRLGADAQRTAALRRVSGTWQPMSWAGLAAQAEDGAWGLLALGIERGEMVSLIGSTRLEWAICDLAVIHAGAVAVPVYHSNTAEEIHFILQTPAPPPAFLQTALPLPTPH